MSTLGLGIGFLLLGLIIAFGIANTTLMMVFERTRDIGVMLTLGTPRSRILLTILTEIGLIAGAASAAGALLSAMVCLALRQTGVPAVSRAMELAIGGVRFYPSVSWPQVLFGFAAVLVLGLLSAVYPAIHASRIDPVPALRFV